MLLHGPSVRLSLRRLVRSRKFLFAALVSLIPAVAGVLLLVEAADGPVGNEYPGYASLDAGMMVLTGTVPLVALLLAGGMIADDVEDRTLSYLLVRPVRRATQYRSRLAAVALATGLLALAQAVLFGVFVGIEWAVWYQDVPYVTHVDYVVGGGRIVETTTSGSVAAGLVGAMLLAAPLGAAALAALFGFVSLVTPRFHFIANLLLFLSWEIPFGAIQNNAGPGLLTVTYASTSLLRRALPDETDWLHPALAVPMLLLWLAFWGSVGAQVMRNRDFTVTSARS